MTKESLMGVCVARSKVRGLKERVNVIFRSLNSIKIDRNRATLRAGGGAPRKTVGFALAVAIIWSLFGVSHLTAQMRRTDFIYLKEFKKPDPDAYVQLTLHLPLVGSPELYRLNIDLSPRLTREFKFDIDDYMLEGNGVFLRLNEPGFIMLAVEDDKASFRPYQELYYRETQRGLSNVIEDYTNTEHHVHYGKKYERKEPKGIGAILADSRFQAAAKWVISLTQLGFLQDTAEAIDAFKGKEETWAVTTSRPENPPRKYFEYSSPEKGKDPYRVFTNDEIYDVRTISWDYLRGYGSGGMGYDGTEGYDINYLFKLKRTRPEVVTFLFIRVVIPYVHISSYGGRETLYPHGRYTTKYVEIEWRVKLAPKGAEPSEEVKTPTSRYQLILSKATWEEAKKDCEKRGGYLATITSEEENDTVARLLRDNGVVEAWIGLTDKDKEKDWKWITGEEKVYEAWAPDEPNDTGGAEDYALIFGDDGKWNDWGMPNDSKHKSFYVCESKTTEPEEKVGTPSAPAGLTGTIACFRRVDLAWKDESTNEKGFYVDRKTGNGYTRVASLPADTTTYTDTGLEPETTYWYKVTAYNDAGESASSSEGSVTTPPVPAQAKLTLASAFDDGVGDVSKYRVDIKLNGHQIYSGYPGVGTSPLEHGRRGKKADSGFQNLKNLEILFDRKLLGGGKNQLEVTLSGVDRKHWFCWESLAVDCIELPYEHYKHRARLHWSLYRSWVHGGETYWSFFTLPQK